MSAVSGILSVGGSSGGATTDEWVSEYQDTILVRNAKGMNAGTTLFGLMSRLKNEPAETTEYKWFERDPVRRVVYASAAEANTGEATLVLDDGETSAKAVPGIIQVGTILQNTRTGEGVRVTSVTGHTATQTTVETARGFIKSAAAINDNDPYVVVTLGRNEGALPAEAVYENPSVLTNYIQTYNSTVELTNAFKGSKLRTDIEGPLKERRVQALERIARDIELSYFFGKAANDVQGENGKTYYTGGIVTAVGDNNNRYLTGGGDNTVTLADFKSWLEEFMTVGSDAKLAFAGPKAYSALSNFANSQSNGFRITGSETVFGMNIQTILTPFGEVSLAMHPLFKEISEYNDWMVVCDLPMLVQKYMEPLFLEPNIQTPGQDSYKEQFRAKYGLKLKFAEAFGYAENLQIIS